MHFVENDELDVTDEIRTLVKHTSEDFRSHDQTIRLGVDLHISSKDANGARTESLFEVSEFLVRECLDR